MKGCTSRLFHTCVPNGVGDKIHVGNRGKSSGRVKTLAVKKHLRNREDCYVTLTFNAGGAR